MKARKATHGLDGQLQDVSSNIGRVQSGPEDLYYYYYDVDRTLRGNLNQNDRGQG